MDLRLHMAGYPPALQQSLRLVGVMLGAFSQDVLGASHSCISALRRRTNNRVFLRARAERLRLQRGANCGCAIQPRDGSELSRLGCDATRGFGGEQQDEEEAKSVEEADHVRERRGA